MRALLYVILILVVAGCGYSSSEYAHGLDEAQALLQNDPAKAFERLNKYDVAQFSDSATMARWALLYGEAMAANHYTAPTDTIIDIAIHYYKAHDLSAEYKRACDVKNLLAVGSETDALVSALYIQKEKEFLLYKERAQRKQWLLIGLVLLFAATTMIFRQRQRIKLQDAQNDALMAEASTLKASLAVRQDECSQLATRLSASLTNRFGIIDELCDTYYESQGSKTEKKAIVEKVKSQIAALKADEGIFSEMERCHADMLTALRDSFPTLKPDEYRLMVYLASGLSNRTIALLIGESIETAYKRKSRLKAKITASDTPEKEQFLAVFHN